MRGRIRIRVNKKCRILFRMKVTRTANLGSLRIKT